MPHRTDEHFSAAIDLIYGAAVDPRLWPNLLRELGGGVDCHFGGMVTSTADRSLFDGIAVGASRQAHQDFLRRFHQNSPFRVGVPLRTGSVKEARHMLSRPALERTEMYQAFYRPHDIGQGVQLTLWRDDHGQQTISLMRSWSRGAFDAEELRWIHALMPHLRRAAEVSRRLRAAAWRSELSLNVLHAVPHPMLLLARNAHVVFANAAAEALSRAGDGLRVNGGALTSPHRTASRQLRTILDAAARPNGVAGTLRLPREAGPPALTLLAMPLRRPTLELMLWPEEAAVLVCVSDPANRDHPPAALLARMFGLTSAEASLAASLVAGKELRAIAEETGRSINTVRNLLARLMVKTETGRQSELIRVLGGLPVTDEINQPSGS